MAHRKGPIDQISQLPDGAWHIARLPGTLEDAIDATAGHFQNHLAPGGYVGLAPFGDAIAVQSHTADGQIEQWRLLRASGPRP